MRTNPLGSTCSANRQIYEEKCDYGLSKQSPGEKKSFKEDSTYKRKLMFLPMNKINLFLFSTVINFKII